MKREGKKITKKKKFNSFSLYTFLSNLFYLELIEKGAYRDCMYNTSTCTCINSPVIKDISMSENLFITFFFFFRFLFVVRVSIIYHSLKVLYVYSVYSVDIT